MLIWRAHLQFMIDSGVEDFARRKDKECCPNNGKSFLSVPPRSFGIISWLVWWMINCCRVWGSSVRIMDTPCPTSSNCYDLFVPFWEQLYHARSKHISGTVRNEYNSITSSSLLIGWSLHWKNLQVDLFFFWKWDISALFKHSSI